MSAPPLPPSPPPSIPPPPTHVILFYRYTPLSPDASVMQEYSNFIRTLTSSLDFRGRILIGQSTDEGVNGTFSGSYYNLSIYVACMSIDLSQFLILPSTSVTASTLSKAVSCYITLNADPLLLAESTHQPLSLTHGATFLQSLITFHKNVPPFTFPPFSIPYSEFKWSPNTLKVEIFPDLYIKVVREIVGGGRAIRGIKIDRTSQGYLTPSEFHTAIESYHSEDPLTSDTIVIDCRNDKEVKIGSFAAAVNPNTKTFYEFPKWVDSSLNSGALKNKKKVLMYCTGGIRCEKASAYIREVAENQGVDDLEVFHLKGGIHRYVETFGSKGLFKGKNFVFDTRQGVRAEEGQDHVKNVGGDNDNNEGDVIIGECRYCCCPHDTFMPSIVCTVCREQVLVCSQCVVDLSRAREYHCEAHFHLKACYFSNLETFNEGELEKMREELEELYVPISVGLKFRSKRATIRKQIEKIDAYLATPHLEVDVDVNVDETTKFCRSCNVAGCVGDCWGYFGVGKGEKLKSDSSAKPIAKLTNPATSVIKVRAITASPAKSKAQVISSPKKISSKDLLIQEITTLNLALPLSAHTDPLTSIRTILPYVLTISTPATGKQCGKTLREILLSSDSDSDSMNMKLIANELILINGLKCTWETELKASDVIVRKIHQHEPPAFTQGSIDNTRLAITVAAFDFDDNHENTESSVYCINKPASWLVSVDPTSSTLANTLLLTAEKELNLPPMTLKPCIQVGREESGLVVCTDDLKTVKAFQRSATGNQVKRLFVACVAGDFSKVVSGRKINGSVDGDGDKVVECSSKISCKDFKSGLRIIDPSSGKETLSRFKFISYDVFKDESIVLAHAVTSRPHQLRVHLQSLGHAVVGDALYGGREENSNNDGSERRFPNVEAACKAVEGAAAASGVGSGSVDDDVIRRFCPCCSLGAASTFSSVDLLGHGSVILLHCFKCSVGVRKEKKEEFFTRRVEVEVDLPYWFDGKGEGVDVGSFDFF